MAGCCLPVSWEAVRHHVVYHVLSLLALLLHRVLPVAAVLVAGLRLETEVVVVGVVVQRQRSQWLLVTMLASLALLLWLTLAPRHQALRVDAKIINY